MLHETRKIVENISLKIWNKVRQMLAQKIMISGERTELIGIFGYYSEAEPFRVHNDRLLKYYKSNDITDKKLRKKINWTKIKINLHQERTIITSRGECDR